MAQTVFEQMGGSYVRQGDYELPAVKLAPEEETHVGVWGQRYRRWLKANHRVLYYNLLTAGRLDRQLAEVDKRTEGMFLRLVEEMAEREGVTENLKATDMMAWGERVPVARKLRAGLRSASVGVGRVPQGRNTRAGQARLAA